MSSGLVVALALPFVCAVLSCRGPNDLIVGGIYSTVDGGGRFGIVKLLVREEGLCHVRVYKQKFASRPEKVDPSELSLGTVHDTDGFGMGHVPLRDEAFRGWQPVLILTTPVTSEELEGYQMWKEASGGAF